MPVTTNTRKLAALLGASGAGIGTDGLMQPAGIDADMASQAELDALETETDEMRTNIALVAFKAATAGSLAKYNLQDQVIDEYTDATGIDASASTNEIFDSGVYISSVAATGGTKTTSGSYNVHTFLRAQSGTNFVTGATISADYIIVAGGGAGGGAGSGDSYNGAGGGGGAGGMEVYSSVSIAAGTFAVVVGAKGIGADGVVGTSGGNSSFNSQTATGGGFGAKGNTPPAVAAANGGSGGGSSRESMTAGTGVSGEGNAGGVAHISVGGGGGGGGKGAVGDVGTGAGGAGGIGLQNAYSGTNVYYAGGGGGGAGGGAGPSNGGAGGSSIGGVGGSHPSGDGTDATANRGSGGGGGGAHTNTSSSSDGGDGSDGIVIIRYVPVINNLTLQSTDTTAEAAPTKADMVMLMEDSLGTATVNTDIKGFVSRDSGVTFIEGTLVDEGDWGTNKRILAFHDLSFTGASGTAMCYKITTHNQSASIQTKIHATSIGWK